MKNKQGNNCYNCPYREEVPGSAHSACKYPEVDPGVLTALALLRNATALEPHIVINEIGRRGGWATWPINFDPVWITCTLNIEQ